MTRKTLQYWYAAETPRDEVQAAKSLMASAGGGGRRGCGYVQYQPRYF